MAEEMKKLMVEYLAALEGPALDGLRWELDFRAVTAALAGNPAMMAVKPETVVRDGARLADAMQKERAARARKETPT